MFDSQFYPFQPIQFMDGLLAPPIGFAAGGIATYIGQVTDTVNGNSFTFTDAAIGPAAADRLVVLCVTTRGGANNRPITGVTIGGNAATSVANISQNIGGTACLNAGIFSLAVAAGTTATIVVNHAATNQNCLVDIYNINNHTSDTATANPTQVSASATTLTVNPDIPAGGIIIAVSAIEDNAGTSTFTWTGVNEDTDVFLENFVRTSASISGLSTETGRTITADPTGTAQMVLAAGVWA